MKTFRSSKLLALILAIALCFGAMYTTAFAAETDAASAEVETPKIISQNVKYGGNFSLMFAIEAASCSGETVTLKVYDEMPTETSKPRWTGTQTSSDELVNVNGIPSYVFTTPGVAAKDMDVNYYVVAESAGVKSEVKKYSVAEYLYERLYGDQTAFAPDAIGKAQADLYKSVLQMGKDAQDLLFNHDDNPDNDRTTFVTDLYYVATQPGIGGAYGLVNGKTSGYLTNGKEALKITTSADTTNLPLTWNVKYIDESGNVTIARDVDLVSFTPTSHMVITPATIAEKPSAYTMDTASAVSSSYIKTGNSSNTVVSLGEYNGSKAAVITLTHNGKFFEFYNGVTKTESNATKLIYDTDITFPAPQEDISGGYARYRFQFTGKSVNGSSCKATTLYVDVFPDGTQRVYDTKNGYKTIPSGTVNVRIEYYEAVVGGETKMVCDSYINGEFYGTVLSSYVYTADGVTANGVNDISWMSIVPPTALNTETPVYQDNLVMAKVAPVAKSFADTMDDPGAHAIDGWTSIPTSFASGKVLSIVDHNNSSAIKFDMSPAGNNESIDFFTQSQADGADKFIFEAKITNAHRARTKLWFYNAKGEIIYDIILNGAGGITAENNGIFWGGGLYPLEEEFILRIEIAITDGKLDFNIFINGILTARPSSYGSVYDLQAYGTKLGNVSNLYRVMFSDNEDSQTYADGYFIFDDIKIETIKTTK